MDYVVATGVTHRLEDFLVAAFAAAGLSDPWQYVSQDPDLLRPAEVMETRGDATKAREQLGWVPEITFAEMVAEMVRVEMVRVDSGIEHSVDYVSRR
jgi:GDPmannose 4,6-dehydratase